MKIRSGFVSNSSSSSFILLGVKMTKDSLMKNPEYKAQFDELMEKERLELIDHWNKKINHPDFEKHKSIYEMCKINNVSIPNEISNFFGYGFNGKFEADKPDKNDIYYEMINEEKFKFPKGIDVLTDDGPVYVGKILSDGDDQLDNGSLSLDKIKEITDNLVNLGFDSSEIKLYYGTRSC